MSAPVPPTRAERLFAAAGRAAAELASGKASVTLPEGLEGQAKRHLIRTEAEHLFLFVVLSVLLEGRPGQAPEDRQTAAELKTIIAERLAEAKTQAKEIARKALKGEEARQFSARLEEADIDPFLPYYDSFEKSRRDPAQAPFAIFARRVCAAHGLPVAAHERLLTLSALLADELLNAL